MEQPPPMMIPGLQAAAMRACDDKNWTPVHILLRQWLKEGTIAYEQLTSIEEGENIIAECCYRGYLSLISLFLDDGFPITYMERSFYFNDTEMLNVATRRGHSCLVKYLLSKGVDINDHDWRGDTALHCAAWKGYTDIVEFLLEKGAGASMYKHNSNKRTPLHLAIFNDRPSVIKLLLEAGCDVNKTNALCYALQRNNLACARILIRFGADVNAYPVLCEAATRNNIPIVSLLFRSGANTLLHTLVNYRSLKTLQYLLYHGANVNIKTNIGHTPLYVALQEGSYDIIQLLLNYKADVSILYSKNDTILHRAVRMHNSQAIIELLLEEDASVDAKNSDNITALYIHAFINYPIGTIIQDPKIYEDVINIVGTLAIWGADINISDNRGHTLLHWAAWRGSLKLVKLLTDLGLNTRTKDQFGKEPIHLAADTKQHDVVHFFIDKFKSQYEV